jgi:hypothetical protein
LDGRADLPVLPFRRELANKAMLVGMGLAGEL